MWRYSGVDDFDLGEFAPVSTSSDDSVRAGTSALAVARRSADAFGPRSALVVTRNGTVIGVEMSPAAPDGALSVGGVLGDPSDASGRRPRSPGQARELLGSVASVHDAFGELHDAYLVDVVVVTVAAKTVVAEPVVVVHLVDRQVQRDQAVSLFPRTLVAVGTSAEAGVIELFVDYPAEPTPVTHERDQTRLEDLPAGADGVGVAGRALVVPVTELDVGDDAHLRYANLQVLGLGATSVGLQASRVGRDATLRSFTAGLGGTYARVRTESDLVGQAGRTALLAAYLGTGHQVHDFRTLQDHHAPRTESELLFKGAVADTARSVYSGLIRIRRGARGANAFQTNHNLVLSEGAHADSVPNLDIDDNDVRCSHASTVGPIDEEQRYYLETRGIEPAVAERLVVMGFFSDLAVRAPFAGVGKWVEAAVARRLAGRLPAEVQAPEASAPEGNDGEGDGHAPDAGHGDG